MKIFLRLVGVLTPKRINLLTLIVMMFALLGVSEGAFAQPGNMSINQDVSGTYTNTSMTLKGGVYQARFQENGSGTTSGTRNWQFNSDGYSNEWGATSGAGVQTLSGYNTTITANTGTASANWYTAGYNSNGRLPATQANYYYTYNIIKGSSYASQRMSVLETSYNPVNISTVSQAAGTYGSRTVAITTSGTPNGSENIYVRYSTNSYTASTIVQATGSGNNWTATIPWQSSAVSFYVYTSPRSKASIDADVTALSSQEVHDLSTLNLNNNSGSNYSWTPTTGNVVVTSTTGTGSAGVGYSTLKLAFDAINAGAIHTGAITVGIAANTTEGTTPATLNSSGAGSASYTSVNIRPISDGVTVSGNPVTGYGVIQLKGADNVTIDGDNPNTAGTNRNLTIANTATNTVAYNSVIRIATATTVVTSADTNTIKNCILNGNVTSGNASGITAATTSSNASFGIYVGGNGGTTATDAPTAITSVTTNTAPSGTTYNTLLIDNNAINQCARGIVINGAATTCSSGVTITNNLVGDQATTLGNTAPFTSPSTTVYVRGIWVNGANGVSITGNTIKNIVSYILGPPASIELAGVIGTGTVSINGNTINGCVLNNSAATSAARGILVSAAGSTYTISGNSITNVQTISTGTTGHACGIEVATSATSATIEKNLITKIYNQNTGAYIAIGLFLNGGNNITVQNNFISDINVYSNNTVTSTTYQPMGIKIGVGTGHKIYFNSINFSGGPLGGSAANGTSCILILSSSQTGMDIRNNIFSNQFTGWTAGSVHACIFIPSGLTSSFNLIINNNAYYASSGNFIAQNSAGTTFTVANFNPAVNTGSTNFRNYTDTLKSTTGNDNASFALSTTPPFTSSTNLRIPTATSTALESGGVVISGITSDIDGADVRCPDVGCPGTGNAPDIGADEFNGINPAWCTGTPTGGTASSSVPSSCSNSTTNLSVTGQTATTATNRITYQWQQASVSGGPYTDISGATNSTYTTATLSATTYFVLKVTCVATGNTALSSEVSFTKLTVPSTCPSNFAPSGTTESQTGTTLTWDAAAGTFTGYKVYMDTNNPPTTLKSTQAGLSYVTGVLSPATTYYWKVITYNACGDATACTTVSSFLTDGTACVPVTFTTSSTNLTCNANSSGTITVTTTAGTSPFLYSKDNGSNYQSSNVFTGLSAGAYQIMVKGNDLCVSTASTVTLTEPTVLVAAAGSDQSVCTGSSAVIGGSPTASGGTIGGGYTYSWSPSTGLSSASVANPTASPTTTTNYTVTVTDGNGCQNTDTVTVTFAAGITKYWAGSGTNLTGGTAGTDFNTAANWSSTGPTGAKTATTAPTSCDNVYFTSTGSAITLSGDIAVNNFELYLSGANNVFNLTVGDLRTLTINGNLTADVTSGNNAQIQFTVGSASGSTGTIIVKGTADFGSNSVAGSVFVRGTAGSNSIWNFQGNVIFGVGSTTSTTNWPGKYIFSGANKTLTVNSAINGFTNVEIGDGTNTCSLTLAGSSNAPLQGGATNGANLTIKANATLDMTTHTLNRSVGGGTFTMEANSTLKLAGSTGGQNGSNFPLNFTPSINNTGATVEYNGPNAVTQTIYAPVTYKNLTLTNSTGSGTTCIKNLSANVTSVAGNLQVNGFTTLDLVSYTMPVTGTGTVASNGIIKSAGTITSTAGLTFQNGGKYQHNYTTTGGAIPTATWDAGSTCEIIGYTNGVAPTGGLGQAFSNFTWNTPGMITSSINLAGALTTVNGNFTVTTTGTDTTIRALRLASSGSPTLTIGGNLIMTAGLLEANGGSTPTATTIINVAGNYQQDGGTVKLTTSSTGGQQLNVTGNVALNAGTFQPGSSTGIPSVSVGGNWSNTAGTYTTNGETVTFNKASGTQTVDNRTSSFGSVTHSGAGTLQLVTNNLTATGTLTNSAGTLDANNLNITVGNNWSNSGTFTAGTGLVTFNATATGKTVAGTLTGSSKFNRITFNGSGGGWTFSNNAEVASDFTITAGTVVAPSSLSVGGNWANSATFTHSSGTVDFTGASTQTLNAGASSFYNLTRSGAGILQLVTNNVTVAGTLALNGGNIDGATNAKDVVVTNSAASAVSRSSGYINANLKRAVATTGSAYLFPVGLSASANYLPASLTFTNLTSGDLTVKANTGDQGNLATSAIDGANSVNANWSLTASAGAVSTNYAGTLAYTSGLNDTPANAGGYITGLYNGSSWSYPALNGTPTSTSLSFTGGSGFGSFAIGGCKTPTTANAGTNQSMCSTSTNVTLAGNNPSPQVGTWSVVSGPSLDVAQFGNVNTYNTTFTPNGGAGTYTLEWSIKILASCSNPSADTVDIIVNAPPTSSTNGGDLSACVGTTTAALGGSTATVGTGLWTCTSAPIGGNTGHITFTDAAVGNTTAIVNASAVAGNYTLTYTISNSPCTASVSTLTLTVSGTPTTSTNGGNLSGCLGSTTAALGGNTPTVGNGLWTVTAAPGGGSTSDITFTSDTTGNTTAIIAGGAVEGAYTLQWTISSSPCTASSSTLTLTVGSSVGWANLQYPSSGTICSNGTYTSYGQVYKSGVTDAGGQGTGISVEFGYSTSNTNPNTWSNWLTASYNTDSGNNDEYQYTFSPPASGTYYYTYRYKSGACGYQYGGYSAGGGNFWDGATYVSGVLTVNASPTAAVISGNASICSGSSTNIQVAITGGVSPYTVAYTSGSVSGYVSGTNISVSPTSTTTYTITSVTGANGCVGTGNSGSAVVTIKTTTTTNGGLTWSDETPSDTTGAIAVVVDGTDDLPLAISANVSACSLTLTNNAVVTVSTGVNVTLSGAITVNSGSTFTLNNNANLLQGGTTNTNSGNIIVKRYTSLIKRLDYTLWSSPVTGQELYAFSPFTFSNRFYRYVTSANAFNNPGLGFSISNLNADGVNGIDDNHVQFATAKGYLIRAPWNHPTTPTIWYGGQFTGVPNNGNISFAMDYEGPEGYRFNLTGNPYPSPIDAAVFVNNANNYANITGALYFWRKTNGSASPTYSDWTSVMGYNNPNNEAPDFDGIIQTGQGFFVEATGTGADLEYTNSMRIADNTNQFFRSANTVERHRIWLKAYNAAGAVSQALFGYVTNATLAVDKNIDAKYINDGEIALTTLIDAVPYSIQGKPLPFDAADIVPLYFKVTSAGTYTIAIDHVDGLFTGGSQAVYLRDNLAGTIHNLNNGAYTFTSAVGTFASRFEILYQMPLSVDNPTFNENQVVIYKNQANDFVINSGNVIMASVKVFDIRGRLLVEKKAINASQTIMNVGAANEVLLVQITSVDGERVTKKVIR